MTYNTKNYTEQGGEKTVIGGTLEIKDEATVVGLSLIVGQSLKKPPARLVDHNGF